MTIAIADATTRFIGTSTIDAGRVAGMLRMPKTLRNRNRRAARAVLSIGNAPWHSSRSLMAFL
jgi:hypothetical protein